MFRCVATGSTGYFVWILFLTLLVAAGIASYVDQTHFGLQVSNMSDWVNWGAYIANFTFLVGVAAAAVLLVVPTYIYHRQDVKEVVLVGELLAFSAIIMCLLFIGVDLGRPDRFWHVLPFWGNLNFPISVLAWDVVVLGGYLLLNLYIPGYLLHMRYQGKEPSKYLYLPFVFISIGWAISIHTVTAFLYSGLAGRPFWNSAILAPRFLVSAFASGPAIMIIIFQVIRRVTNFQVKETVLDLLKNIVKWVIPINLFFLGCEVFKEFYTNTTHVASAQYLFLGLHGKHMLVPYIWTAILFSITAGFIFAIPSLRKNNRLTSIGAVLTILGVWIEKGMGLIVPGFIPSSLGDLHEYTPSVNEFFVCLGIWSLGALIFTLLAKVSITIQLGDLNPDLKKSSLHHVIPAR